MHEFQRSLLALLEDGQSCATATLVGNKGSTPGKPGHRMIVLPDASIRFTIGGGPLEAMVIQDCLSQISGRKNAIKDYRLLPEGPDAVGMVCGGQATVFIEVHPPGPTLLVFGAGHVGSAVMEMARGLGFRRLLADDRKIFLGRHQDDASLATFHCPDSFSGALPDLDGNTFVVIVTRCHKTDREILYRLAGKPMAYLGMIGSRRKVKTVLDELEVRHISRDNLAHLRAPIGIRIGARTPREIALSILAEVVSTRNGISSTH